MNDLALLDRMTKVNVKCKEENYKVKAEKMQAVNKEQHDCHEKMMNEKDVCHKSIQELQNEMMNKCSKPEKAATTPKSNDDAFKGMNYGLGLSYCMSCHADKDKINNDKYEAEKKVETLQHKLETNSRECLRNQTDLSDKWEKRFNKLEKRSNDTHAEHHSISKRNKVLINRLARMTEKHKDCEHEKEIHDFKRQTMSQSLHNCTLFYGNQGKALDTVNDTINQLKENSKLWSQKYYECAKKNNSCSVEVDAGTQLEKEELALSLKMRQRSITIAFLILPTHKYKFKGLKMSYTS